MDALGGVRSRSTLLRLVFQSKIDRTRVSGCVKLRMRTRVRTINAYYKPIMQC